MKCPRTVFLTMGLVAIALLTLHAQASITLSGNIEGNPKSVPKAPCPRHPSCYCASTLNPDKVTLISSPTTFRGASICRNSASASSCMASDSW